MLKTKTNKKAKKSSQKEKELNYFAKDNFWTKDFSATASSFFLNDFNPGEEATVIKLLKEHKQF